MLSGDLRVDGDDAIAMVLQRLHDLVARSIRPVRCAYHRDGAHRLQQVPDFLVGREWHVSLLSPAPPTPAGRSEERRVGKACDGSGRYRVGSVHLKKKNKN